MTIRGQRDFLKVQLLNTQRLKSLAGDHSLMSIAFQERETELRQQIEELPVG